MYKYFKFILRYNLFFKYIYMKNKISEIDILKLLIVVQLWSKVANLSATIDVFIKAYEPLHGSSSHFNV